MPFYEHRDVQFSEPRLIRDYLREINARMREIGQALTNNRRQTINEVTQAITGNGTNTIFIADADYDVEAVLHYSAGASGTVSLSINATAVTGSSQTPTATPTRYALSQDNRLTRGDRLTYTTSGTSGENVASAILRRLT